METILEFLKNPESLIMALIIFFLIFVLLNTKIFTPTTGHIYIFSFLGDHLFQIQLKEENKWYQKLSFYILFPFLKVPHFTYHWTQTMSLDRAKQKEEEINKSGMKGAKCYILWQQKRGGTEDKRQDSELGAIIMRSETMNNLREIERFVFSAEFETADGFRGDRIFELFLKIENLSLITTKTTIFQQVASNLFRTAYQNWAKSQNYADIRKISIEKILSELDATDDKSDIQKKINGYLEEGKYGYCIDRIAMLDIYLAPESLDMIEKQEEKRKAELEQSAEKVKAETLKIQTEAQKDRTILLSEGEAKKIQNIGIAEAETEKAIGSAKAEVLGLQTQKLNEFIDEATEDIVKQHAAKYGAKGLGKENGTVIISGTSGDDIQIGRLAEILIANTISKNKGVENEKK